MGQSRGKEEIRQRGGGGKETPKGQEKQKRNDRVTA